MINKNFKVRCAKCGMIIDTTKVRDCEDLEDFVDYLRIDVPGTGWFECPLCKDVTKFEIDFGDHGRYPWK